MRYCLRAIALGECEVYNQAEYNALKRRSAIH